MARSAIAHHQLYRVFDPPESNPISRFSRSVVPNSKKTKDQTFAFDKVFDDNTTQGDVYEGTTKPLLDNVLEGYNATVFAYGATGCGKTHTITYVLQALSCRGYHELTQLQGHTPTTGHHLPHDAGAL